MHDRRAICPHIPRLGEADYRLCRLSKRFDSIVSETAQTVRARDHIERSVVCIDPINMYAKRDHRLDHPLRRLDVGLARFDCPRAKSGHIVAFGDRNRPILVWPESPVLRRGLVEQQHPHGKCGRAKQFRSKRSQRTISANQVSNWFRF